MSTIEILILALGFIVAAFGFTVGILGDSLEGKGRMISAIFAVAMLTVSFPATGLGIHYLA